MSPYLKSLLAAIIGGAATGVAQASQSGGSLKVTGVTAAVGAIVGVLGYLTQPPTKAVVATQVATPAATKPETPAS